MQQQLWIGRISDLKTALAPLIDEQLRAYVQSFSESRQQTLLAGRALLKFALWQQGILQLNQPLPKIAYSKLNKPYFVDIPVYFNLSHSHDFIALTIGKQPQGVDMELINQQRPLKKALLCKVLKDKEWQLFQHIQHSEQFLSAQLPYRVMALDKEHGTDAKSLDKEHGTDAKVLDKEHSTDARTEDKEHSTDAKVLDKEHGTDAKALDKESCTDLKTTWFSTSKSEDRAKHQAQATAHAEYRKILTRYKEKNLMLEPKTFVDSFTDAKQSKASVDLVGHRLAVDCGELFLNSQSANRAYTDNTYTANSQNEHTCEQQQGVDNTYATFSCVNYNHADHSQQVSLLNQDHIEPKNSLSISQAAREFFFMQWTVKECLLKLQGASIFALDCLRFDPILHKVTYSNTSARDSVDIVNTWFKQTLSYKLSTLYRDLTPLEHDFWLTVGIYDSAPQIFVFADHSTIDRQKLWASVDKEQIVAENESGDQGAVKVRALPIDTDLNLLADSDLNLPTDSELVHLESWAAYMCTQWHMVNHGAEFEYNICLS